MSWNKLFQGKKATIERMAMDICRDILNEAKDTLHEDKDLDIKRSIILFQDGSLFTLVGDCYSDYHPVTQAINYKIAVEVFNAKLEDMLYWAEVFFEELCYEHNDYLINYYYQHYVEVHDDVPLWEFIKNDDEEEYQIIMNKYLTHLIENLEELSKSLIDSEHRRALRKMKEIDEIIEREGILTNNNTIFIYHNYFKDKLLAMYTDYDRAHRATSDELRLHAKIQINKGEEPWGAKSKYVYLADGVFCWDSEAEDYVKQEDVKIFKL